MKKQFLIVTIFFLTLTVGHGQTTFQKIFGGSEQDGGFSVIQTEDSGYVFTGYWTTGGIENMFLIKTNSYGNVIWSHKFEDSPDPPFRTGGYSVVETNDKGFAVVGYNQISTVGLDPQVFLVKTDSNGDSLWSKSFGQMYSDVAYSVKQTLDGGFILTGYTDTTYGSVGHILLIKTQVNGDLLWCKSIGFGGYRNEESHSVLETSDGGYAILGSSSVDIYPDDIDIFLFRTDANGDTLWTKKYGGINEDVGYSVQQTQDDGFVIAASTMSFGTGGYDVYLIRTDSSGDTLWTKTFGGLDNEWGNYVNTTSDGGYIIAGSTQSFSSGGYDVYLIKTDVNGNKQWSKSFGGILDDYGYSVQQTFDGGYIIVGMRGDNIYLIKTDGNGNATGTNEIDMPSLVPQIYIFPNPFSSETTIRTVKNMQDATLTIYNTHGQELKRIKNISGQTITLHRDNLSNGLYFLQLTQDNKILTTDKIIITDR